MWKWFGRCGALVVTAVTGGGAIFAAGGPVEFAFEPGAATGEPFAREIWAEVTTPAQQRLRLPAFYAGDGVFAVRARATVAGEYRLGAITETDAQGVSVALAHRPRGVATREVAPAEVEGLPQVGIDPAAREKFVTSDGKFFTPLGANLAWAEDADRVGWYGKAFRAFRGAGLNWTRVWMAHWGGLDLSWLPEEMGPSPRPGELDQRVARNWDAILAAAEEQGVYVQLVLQHHGPLSSQVNANWAPNPWNAANAGGFLRTAGDFFTAAEAVRLTKQKYRTIVARWGYSPSIMAWELFNEVHWVDALRIEHNEAAVARWHDEMAAYLRSLDVYGHLVTTSTEDLRSPIYRSMDYYQPHLYPVNALAAVRQLEARPEGASRPVFYGEQGDDNLHFTAEQRDAAVEAAPIMWASLMGQGRYAAQPWEGGQIMARGRLGELQAVGRFLGATGLQEREGLVAFSPVVEGEASEPLVLEPGYKWRRQPPPDLRLSVRGAWPVELGRMPGIYVGSPKSVEEGYTDRATLRVDYPAAAVARLNIGEVGKKGAVVRVEVDGVAAVEAKLASGPAEVPFDVPAGEHAISIRNVGGEDWFELAGLDLGRKVSPLTAIGRRGGDFIAVWVWNRRGVFTLADVAPGRGEVVIEDVPAGAWQAIWWDSVAGEPAEARVLEHPGGTMRVPTPPISRHAALVLRR